MADSVVSRVNTAWGTLLKGKKGVSERSLSLAQRLEAEVTDQATTTFLNELAESYPETANM